ncbi:MAG: CinA family protein [Treponema sp.]|nr:CinA family protein [Treponema sp.]
MNYSESVTKKLIQNNLTISFMESCTSGLLASMFTDTEGASKVFTGSLVTYSNEQKIKAGVKAEVISDFGVYSKECAAEMARTVQEIYGTDISVGITGTTGNVDPENPDSVQGEAFFCIRIKTESYDFHIQADVTEMSRKEIKQFYADTVYAELLKILK